ncbi:MAG TPA: sigma-70 family RNA polymerase sigma factor [Pyrinomonadaceae bacterium]
MSQRPTAVHIIAACQHGDREAFRLLFEAYKDKVFSIALYFFGGDEAVADDVTQQVFVKLFTKLEQFRNESEFTTWLYRLATNACIDEQRKRRRFIPFGDAFKTREPREKKSQEDGFARREIADSVQTAIATLRPKLRIAILLKYFDELSYEEIASVLNCSTGTVASRLNRGHQILARRLAHLRDTLVRGEQN